MDSGLSSTTSAPWLNGCAKDVYSQGGEDGVIAAILELLPERDQWCVEVGASDGSYLSNTRNLIERGYSAVQIEADAGRFATLARRYRDRDDVFTIASRAGFGPDDGLDSLLADTPIPANFDFLSIDVDGHDVHIWTALTAYRPKVICIEFNPTMPTDLVFAQALDGHAVTGSSVRALVDVGLKKGYELVAVLGVNAFFVEQGYFPTMKVPANDPATLRTDETLVTHIFSGYDGTVHLAGNQTLPWHHVRLRPSTVQAIPRWLRRFPSDYARSQIVGLGLFLAITDRRELWRWIRARRARSRLPD